MKDAQMNDRRQLIREMQVEMVAGREEKSTRHTTHTTHDTHDILDTTHVAIAGCWDKEIFSSIKPSLAHGQILHGNGLKM